MKRVDYFLLLFLNAAHGDPKNKILIGISTKLRCIIKENGLEKGIVTNVPI